MKFSRNNLSSALSLFANPGRLRHVLVREMFFGSRYCSRQEWVKWQKYDACKHIGFMETHPVALRRDLLHKTRVETISTMIGSLGSDLQVLDVGCGNGALCRPLRQMGNQVTCVELPGVAYLTHRCGVNRIVAGDAENLAFASGSFDLILASEVAEHLWMPKLFFKEAYRLLKPDGYMIVSTPEGELSLCYDSHRHFFNKERIMQVVGTNFVLIQANYLKPNGNPTPTLILLLKKSSTSRNA